MRTPIHRLCANINEKNYMAKRLIAQVGIKKKICDEQRVSKGTLTRVFRGDIEGSELRTRLYELAKKQYRAKPE